VRVARFSFVPVKFQVAVFSVQYIGYVSSKASNDFQEGESE
jgi:hypothetical protein